MFASLRQTAPGNIKIIKLTKDSKSCLKENEI